MYSTHSNQRTVSSVFFLSRSDARGWRNARCGKSHGARAWWREWHHSRYGVGTAIRGTTVVVPTAGFHEEAATPRGSTPSSRRSTAGFVRAHMSFLSVAVQLTRRIRRTKTLLQILGTAVGASSRRRRREFCGSIEYHRLT